ncbi:protein DOUBLE-STRAND BREAK FORMATION [Salvia hispanica]|uniref:protein DOUBLE-STRAND BREAK FORMATION n=1 Tax=Salvia hispanica TaxID=49212 RepID=UPI002009B0B1|nr:protein DOUBLE-STRAND BREAK FORMATION [Salvia hispanica]
MPHSATIYQEISLFRSRIQNRWVDDVTIRVLESILVSKDVQSSIDFKSVLKRFMRDESLLIFGEIAEESVETKLTCAEFLIRVFAMIGDVESCLALRYEALVLRDEMTTIHPELQVTSKEWLTFTEHSVENGFHSIANQACEKAHMSSGAIHLESDDLFHDVNAMEKIDRLKDGALLKISSQSVQAQAKAYSKWKKVKESAQQLTIPTESQKGSSLFRSGIKMHNLRKLHEYQRLQMKGICN